MTNAPSKPSNAKPPLKLDVYIFMPCYGGNGGISAVHPHVALWYTETVMKMKADPRIGQIHAEFLGDTPITMSRNAAVIKAQKAGAHLLLMCDSDQGPQLHVKEPWFKPFWDVALDEVYNHYQKGPLVIGAPYCGPPPMENVYVFQFETNMSNLGDESVVRLEQYTRSQASLMSGVGEVAALPTGMILFDMRIFDLCKPSNKPKRQVLRELREGTIDIDQAERELTEGWFYYEWKDGTASEKASTEDVTVTRDMGLACAAKLGYNPLRCAWDSWIGHHKPWNVGKPKPYKVENFGATLRGVVEQNHSVEDRMINFRSDLLDTLQVPSINGNGNGHAKRRRTAKTR